ncbi:MAG: thymidine phosphorylase [Oscillospiraceae bacterium]|nr:thymidine phosphorylase [Oscillospiraceae bacterium]
MRIYDIIAKKRDRFELTDEEIAFFVKGCTEKTIADYQTTALLMAIYLNGMTDREMITLTNEMAHSGELLDLSAIDGITADKHSTGGVGDKTTLIVAPIVASCGVRIAKLSGRGLGHTGGTVDKLESIDGFRVSLTPEEFIQQVNDIGICVTGQTGNLAPADKIIYGLRDATATVGSIPLIASSIMSKKLAAGAECIVLDVKVGSGAFMKTLDETKELSQKMIDIGKANGRKMAAVLSDMDTPLGKNIGNTLEVMEAVDVLKNGLQSDLTEVCVVLASNILALAKAVSLEEAEKQVRRSLSDGSAYETFKKLVRTQGGDTLLIENTDKFKKAAFCREVPSPADGYISSMNAETIGLASVALGAGRKTKEDTIDYTAGIVLEKKTGEAVKKGDVLARLYTNKDNCLDESERMFLSALDFSEEKPTEKPLIYDVMR